MGSRPAARRTETERDIQAELRAFALVLGAIEGRMRALRPALEQLPAYKACLKASRAGDDERNTVAWTLHGDLDHDSEQLREIVERMRDGAGMTDEDAAAAEARARKRNAQAQRSIEQARQRRAELEAALAAATEKAEALHGKSDALRDEAHTTDDNVARIRDELREHVWRTEGRRIR